MPDGTNNIWLNSTFTSTGAGSTSVANEVEFVTADNIGNYDVPVVYQTRSSLAEDIDSNIEYLANYTTTSGVDDILLSFFREIDTVSGTIICLIDHTTGVTISESLDNHVAYLTGYNVVSGTIDEKLIYIAGERYNSFKSYLVEHRYETVVSGSKDYWQAYMNYTGSTSVEGYHIATYSGIRSLITEYGISDKDDGGLISYVDITFAGWVDFLFSGDVFSTDMAISNPYLCDVLTISGGVTPHYLDVYSAQLTTSGIKNDIYCSLLSLGDLLTDVELIQGRVGYLTEDVYSTIVTTSGITCDISLYSLKITNFSLDIGEYTTASNYISVDVLDDVYGVMTSGTYFKVDSYRVPVTFSGIDDGYRMFYDPIDDFNSLTGSTVFTVRGENNNGDTLEKDFYLTFGYLVEYKNYQGIGWDYGYNTKVTVRITAENYASCPKLDSDGHRFITECRKSNDLGASIIGLFHADDHTDLSAEIYPVSSAYFYGKTFEVIINAKDFAGNAMEPFILQYKIEDKPE